MHTRECYFVILDTFYLNSLNMQSYKAVLFSFVILGQNKVHIAF